MPSSSYDASSTTSPKAFNTSGHYGLLGNRRRGEALAHIRALLDQRPTATTPEPAEAITDLPPRDACPQCGTGQMVVVASFSPVAAPHRTPRSLVWDPS